MASYAEFDAECMRDLPEEGIELTELRRELDLARKESHRLLESRQTVFAESSLISQNRALIEEQLNGPIRDQDASGRLENSFSETLMARHEAAKAIEQQLDGYNERLEQIIDLAERQLQRDQDAAELAARSPDAEGALRAMHESMQDLTAISIEARTVATLIRGSRAADPSRRGVAPSAADRSTAEPGGNGRPMSEEQVNLELERRQAEGAREFGNRPEDRAAFAREVGQVEHLDWQAEIRRTEAAKGRVEGRDFAIEYKIRHPDSGFVRYDYVDFQNDRIVDRKAQSVGESDLDLARRYVQQQQRHVEAYRATFGREPVYEYAAYPSTKDLFQAEFPPEASAVSPTQVERPAATESAWVDRGISSVKTTELPEQNDIGAADFQKVSEQEMREGLLRLQEMLPVIKSGEGANNQFWERKDAELGLPFERGYQRIYEAFYGDDAIRVTKDGDRYDVTNGRHRIHLAQEMGIKELPIRVVERDKGGGTNARNSGRH